MRQSEAGYTEPCRLDQGVDYDCVCLYTHGIWEYNIILRNQESLALFFLARLSKIEKWISYKIEPFCRL